MTLASEPKGTVARERKKLLIGLRDAGPNVVRLFTPPSVMASPPTIANGTGVGGSDPASTISSAVKTRGTDSRFRYFCGAVGTAGSSNDANYLKSVHLTTPNNGPPFNFDFEIDCVAFEFLFKGNGAYYRLSIDGAPATAAMTQLPSDGLYYTVKVTFSGRGMHRISVRCGGGLFFGGIYTGPIDTFWKSSVPLGKRVILVGDSFGEGTGATSGQEALNGFIPQLAGLMGWQDFWMSALGGTGYLNPSTGGKVNFQSRVDHDVSGYAPDLVLWSGGLNDEPSSFPSWTQIAEQAAAEYCYGRVHTALPATPQIVIGNFNSRGGSSTPSSRVQIRDALSSAATNQHAALFVDSIGGAIPYDGTIAHYFNTGWLTGTGNVGSPTGGGNTDLYTSSDQTHPTDAGHAYIARRIASALSVAIAAGAF